MFPYAVDHMLSYLASGNKQLPLVKPLSQHLLDMCWELSNPWKCVCCGTVLCVCWEKVRQDMLQPRWNCPVLQDGEGRLLSWCKSSRLATQWSWVWSGLGFMWGTAPGSLSQKQNAQVKWNGERRTVFIHPLTKCKWSNCRPSWQRCEVLSWANFHPLLPLATSPEAQHAHRLGVAKCMLPTSSVLRGRVCQWSTELLDQLVRQ